MEGIRYTNLVQNGLIVMEIQGDENSNLVVPVNYTLVCCMSFLAADTWPVS